MHVPAACLPLPLPPYGTPPPSAGNAVAERRRMPSARAFDFFLETSYVEVYREEVHDLFARPTGGNRAPLQVCGVGSHKLGRRMAAAPCDAARAKFRVPPPLLTMATGAHSLGSGM